MVTACCSHVFWAGQMRSPRGHDTAVPTLHPPPHPLFHRRGQRSDLPQYSRGLGRDPGRALCPVFQGSAGGQTAPSFAHAATPSDRLRATGPTWLPTNGSRQGPARHASCPKKNTGECTLKKKGRCRLRQRPFDWTVNGDQILNLATISLSFSAMVASSSALTLT